MVIIVIIGIVILILIILFNVNSYTCKNRYISGQHSGIVQRDLAAPTTYTTDGTRGIIYGKYVVNLVDENTDRALPPSITPENQEPSMVFLSYRTFMPPVLDQGLGGACTVNSLVNLLFFLDQNTDSDGSIKLGLKKPAQLRSRMYIFYCELTQFGETFPNIFRAVNAYQRYGAPPESLWPYDMSSLFSNITPNMVIPPPCLAAATCPVKMRDETFLKPLRAQSAPSRIPNYYSVPVSPFNHNILKNALRKYGPLYIRIHATSAWTTTTSDGIIHSSDDEVLIGGHAILLVGYDDTKSMYTIMNSWSTAWGDGGYGYIPYANAEKYIKYAIAFSLRPTVVTTGSSSTPSTMETMTDFVEHPCGSILQANRGNWIKYRDVRDPNTLTVGCDFTYCTNPDIIRCGVSGGSKYQGCGNKDTMDDCYKSDITSPVFEIIDKPCSDVLKTQKRVTAYATTSNNSCYVTYAAPNVAEKDVPPAKNLGCVGYNETDKKAVSVDCSEFIKSKSAYPSRSPSK
jgi:Papain family cysteine protease